MATKKQTTGDADAIDALVLRDCQYGNAGDVVTLPADEAETGAKQGALDLHPDAIEAAKAE